MIESSEEIRPVPPSVKKCSKCHEQRAASEFRKHSRICIECYRRYARERGRIPEIREQKKKYFKEWRTRPDVAKSRADYMKNGRGREAQDLWSKSKERRESSMRYVKSIKGKAKAMEWQASPQGRASSRNARYRRRAKIKNGTATSRDIRKILDEATKCRYCLASFGKRRVKSIDHIMPLVRGGLHSVENLVVCCRSCNSKKKASLPEEWAARIGLLLI